MPGDWKPAASSPPLRAIDLNACARPIEVDDRFPLQYYYRIAANLLTQASIYRKEENLIDLYIMLLRFSSLVCETIPSHRDYQVLLPKERATFKKKLLSVLDELESLKPHVQHQFLDINSGLESQLDGHEATSDYLTPNSHSKKQIYSSRPLEMPAMRSVSQSSGKLNNERNQVVSSNQFQKDFKKISLSLPYPKEETLSRHSVLGPNGFNSQWTGPIASIKVHYPSSIDSTKAEIPRLNQDGEYGVIAVEKGDSERTSSVMDSILSLDDGRWSIPAEEPCSVATSAMQEDFLQLNIRQPSPPPTLAPLQRASHPIPPSRVADPRPGPPIPSLDGVDGKAYQDLHIPEMMLKSFLRLAEMNTAKNLETCGVLAGSLKNRVFFVTTLIIPKQESTSDSCQTTDEEEIFDVQDKRSLFPLGWIHTHPTQTCFMSSIDLHTHYSYQVMLPEAVAVVMAPTDTTRNFGIFHLSDPSGVSVIRNCQERGFHPHEETPDGSPIYEMCSHVYMNPSVKFDVVDLRNR